MTTAAERTVEALRADILTGALEPGEQLRQEVVAARYDVSRVPVREALQLLASEGLVSHLPNRGFFVTELSISDLLEVYRLRRILEAEAIEVAVPALRDEDVDHLRMLAAAVDEAAAQGDIQAITATNRRFHFAVFEAAGMPRLTKLLQQLWDASDIYRSLYFGQTGNRERVRAEHDQMLAAIAARDVNTTVRLHNEHRDHSVAWVQSQLLRERSRYRAPTQEK